MIKKEYDLSDQGIKGNDRVLLSTGRSAIRYVLEQSADKIKTRKALLPSYTCETVVEPFRAMGYEIDTYPIDDSLMLHGETLKQTLYETESSVVLFHRYFGFDTLKDCKEVIRYFRDHGTVFIEDRTQNIFSTHSLIETDYTVGSLRKWLGMPDGSYAVSYGRYFFNKPDSFDGKLEKAKIMACQKKYLYMEGKEENKAEFLNLYREAEDILNSQKGFYSISPVSEAIWSNADFHNIKNRRRENYEYLYRCLADCKDIQIVTPVLSDNDTPLYLMISVKDRNRLQERLRFYEIFAPVVWERPRWLLDVCKEAEEMYRSCLCLPIDQRYGQDDMARSAEAVLTEVCR